MDLVFQSCVPVRYRHALERLVFFNPNQVSMQGAIARALDLYGTPEIVSGPAGLSLRVSGCLEAQCLFALDTDRRAALAGMLVYLRTSIEEILVVHIAVSETHGRTRRTGMGVAMRLIRELRASARQLRGVQWIRLLYTDDRHYQIRLSARPGPESFEPAPARPIRLVS
jgi:hypothetical protein